MLEASFYEVIGIFMMGILIVNFFLAFSKN